MMATTALLLTQVSFGLLAYGLSRSIDDLKNALHEHETGFRRRSIWFWQMKRFLKDGWSIQRIGFDSSFIFWLNAAISHLRPTASKKIGPAHPEISVNVTVDSSGRLIPVVGEAR